MGKKIQYIFYFIVVVIAAFGTYWYLDLFIIPPEKFYYIDINSRTVLFETDEKFLSVALDVSFMRCLFHKFTDSDWKKLEELSRLLSPAYLRFGGTDADRLIFDATTPGPFLANETCSNYYNEKGNITVTGEDWIKFNKFVQTTGLNLIIDLNVLLRNNSEWDSTNAEALIKFSQENGFPLHFQLGNEPNSFPHVFNTTITGKQLAKDFHKLRKLLNSTEAYQKSKLIGPDVTRPKLLGTSSLVYLKEFLRKGDVVDVASWHQYYLNGRNATLEDFINPETLDVLPEQIDAILRVVREFSPTMPIWISETSSAYGGGAPKLSNSFVASFLWLDKLGVAARSNMSVVIRQSLFKDHYALVTDKLTPSPDFWISLLYKNLVGRQVLDVKVSDSTSNLLRFYGHCLVSNSTLNGTFVIYGMNLSNKTEVLVPSGISISYPVYAYIFRPEFQNLQSKTVLLNDRPLVYNATVAADIVNQWKAVEYPLEIPDYSIAFWVFTEMVSSACRK